MYYLITVRNNYNYDTSEFLVNSEECITQFIRGIPAKEHSFSGQWKLRGFVRVAPFGQSGLIIPLKEMFKLGYVNNLLFKNGHGRYLVCDIDHGTRREWSSRRLIGLEKREDGVF